MSPARVWLLIVLAAVPAAVGDGVPAGYQSPPYYPTPKGGWLPEWAASYAKAQLVVRDMTLAEKVNLTTGTGLFMVSGMAGAGARRPGNVGATRALARATPARRCGLASRISVWPIRPLESPRRTITPPSQPASPSAPPSTRR